MKPGDRVCRRVDPTRVGIVVEMPISRDGELVLVAWDETDRDDALTTVVHGSAIRRFTDD
jgi:hypothetical protein